MSDWVGDIEALHRKYPGGPLRRLVGQLTPAAMAEYLRFRVDFLREELAETEGAQSPADFVDGVIDLCVVAIGTLDAMGVDAREAWRRVHRANMSKEPGCNPRRPNRFGFPDLTKPPGWAAPDHSDNVGVLGAALRMKADLGRLGRRDRRYYGLAEYVAGWSKDPTTKVGAVLVGTDNRKVALGYNGFPPKIEDSAERLNDRPTKHKLTMHAERNVLDNADFPSAGATLYSTQVPCSECAKSVVSRGVGRVVCPSPRGLAPPWDEDARWAALLLGEGGVQVEFVDGAYEGGGRDA